jgi:glycosyltransferase involved in cell wall biosynthesis
VRLAWFSPWPPQTSGIAGRSAEVVPLLAARNHGIDVFVDESVVPVRRHDDTPPVPGQIRVESAHDFVWRAGRGQYDLVVYQAGNSRLHEFIWPYLLHWPGLVVLHDARLHHARGRAYLIRRRADAYRAEFARNHPDITRDAAELAVRGFDGAYYYLWPMTASIVAASRAVAVHTFGGARLLADAHPDRQITYLPLGEGARHVAGDDERAAVREALGVEPGASLVGVFGALTAERRVPQVLAAFRSTCAHDARARLLLAGRPDPALGLPALVKSLGLDDAVIWRDRLNDDDFDLAIAATDIVVNLRWPSAMETSGPWLRAMAAARATVVVDLPHQAHVPALDPRTWRPWTGGDHRDPVSVAIDILDEDHSLRLALRRLTRDAHLRDTLGAAARAYWETEHTVERMVDGYEEVLAGAVTQPMPARPTPPPDEARLQHYAASILTPFGPDVSCELF